MKRDNLIALVIFFVFSICSFSYSVALMITGEVGGNPIYEMMRDGAVRISEEKGIELKIVEGGYNSSKWEQNLIALASIGKYDLIITFTEGMPSSVEKAAKMFPNQKFALIDGIAKADKNVFSLGFKDEEMTYIAGYLAGMVTVSNMENANSQKKIGLVAGDIYPAMTDRMLPAYRNGARMADENVQVDFSVAGSWGDPNKGRELAISLFDSGVDVVLSISGGTGVGIIEAAKNKGKYYIGVDSNVISYAPGTILACTLKKADNAIYDVISRAYDGSLIFGNAERWGIAQGVIDFTFEDTDFIKYVPEDIRNSVRDVFERLKTGEINPLQ